MSALLHVNRPTTHRRYQQVAALLVSVLLVGTLIARTSSAAFTATHENTPNEFSAASIDLDGDDSGTAMFDVSDMVPGATEEACITITYTGAPEAGVVLYGAVSGDLAGYLDVTIERDDDAGGEFGDCTGFAGDATVYDGTFAGFGTTHGDYDNGAGLWTANDQDAVTYRVTVDLQSDDDAQGESATVTFTWEARTTS